LKARAQQIASSLKLIWKILFISITSSRDVSQTLAEKQKIITQEKLEHYKYLTQQTYMTMP
jgi:hypothetical protein